MDPQEFVTRWARQLAPKAREAFRAELAMLLELEQARERRRLCTDAALYQKACEETAEEIRRHASVTEKSTTTSATPRHEIA